MSAPHSTALQATRAEARAAEGAPGGPTEEGHGEDSGQQQENSPSSSTILEYKESLVYHTSSTSDRLLIVRA